jgi:superfamily II DNA or RNA helicase
MLTEGWDANTVTHVLGIRAFGTQLLCEQVIGRALRRQSYELNEEGLFNVEYADVFGIPFDFTAKPVIGATAAAARDRAGQGHAPRARRAGDPLSPRRRLPRRAARGTLSATSTTSPS